MNAEEIVEIREKLNKTQEQFAKMLGVSLRTVQNYEGGSVIPQSKHELLRKLSLEYEINTAKEPPTTYSKVPEQTQTLDTMDENYLRKYVQLLEKNLQEKEEIINQQKEEINALKSRKA